MGGECHLPRVARRWCGASMSRHATPNGAKATASTRHTGTMPHGMPGLDRGEASQRSRPNQKATTPRIHCSTCKHAAQEQDHPPNRWSIQHEVADRGNTRASYCGQTEGMRRPRTPEGRHFQHDVG